MLFKNKKKLDSRVRFQNRGFRNRLNSQRNYKRSVRNLPQTDWAVFLSKVGLGSWLSRILTLAVFLLLVYIVYIPNFFFIKQITITGLNQVSENQIKNSVSSFLKKQTPWPQKNLLLMSKTKLGVFLIENNKQILQINKISKKFPNTLSLGFTERVDKFVIQTLSREYYALSQDGLITSRIYPDASGNLPSGLILIKLNKDSLLNLNQKPFKQGEFDFILNTASRMPGSLKTDITNFEVSDFLNPYFSINTKIGFVIKLDPSSDFEKTLNRLNLLIGQILPGDLKNLSYIDLRFVDRAYTCSKNNHCTNDTLPQETSTEAKIPN